MIIAHICHFLLSHFVLIIYHCSHLLISAHNCSLLTFAHFCSWFAHCSHLLIIEDALRGILYIEYQRSDRFYFLHYWQWRQNEQYEQLMTIKAHRRHENVRWKQHFDAFHARDVFIATWVYSLAQTYYSQTCSRNTVEQLTIYFLSYLQLYRL
jgi:hypothetical protein